MTDALTVLTGVAIVLTALAVTGLGVLAARLSRLEKDLEALWGD